MKQQTLKQQSCVANLKHLVAKKREMEHVGAPSPTDVEADGNVSLHFACLGRGAASLDALAAANPDAPWAAHGRAGVVAALLDSGEGRPVLQGKFADERKVGPPPPVFVACAHAARWH